MSQPTWRLVTTTAADGPLNMAIDQAIMEAVAARQVPPTLRFYAWEPPCLSLGYTQPITDVDRAQLQKHGWDIVRRATGGRAILHTDELTYSVAVCDDDPIVAGGIVESYRRLSQALVHGLNSIGAAPQADKRADGHGNSKGPVCFEVPSHYEITINEKKLVGSAQVRKFGAVLQHGSLPLQGDIARICEALVFENDEQRERIKERVRRRATTLERAIGRIVSWDEAAVVMTRSFQTIFDLVFTGQTLTDNEWARAEHLRHEQYAAESWHARF